MAQPYVGEIRLFAGNFAPAGWQFCWGQMLPISENETLFQLIGTTYGGDGQSTFALPNLASRVPIHQGPGTDGNSYQVSDTGGVESVTLTTQQIPIHSHAMLGSVNTANSNQPGNNVPATLPIALQQFPYGQSSPILPLDPSSITPVGGSQPHSNMQPFNTLNYIISLFGIFPSQT
jgi:microcystin-dependent protein